MTRLTFFGGVDEIGGNKILLEDQDTRLFLDFGMSFNQSGMYFSEFLMPRNCNGLGDYFATGLLPDLKGVYRQDYLRHMGRPNEDRLIDAVLISHAHMDHMSYLHHLRCDIDLVMSQGTHAICQTLQQTRSSGVNDLLIQTPSFKIRPSKRGDGFTKVTKRDGYQERPVNVIDYESSFKVGDLEIVAYEVDHSVPGATAFLIYTSEGSILYTGDYRFHGYLGSKTRNMIEKVSNEDVEATITEGTRITSMGGTTETQVYAQAKQLVESTKGLAIVTFPPRDLTRLSTFHRIAKETGRKLVIDFTQAYLLEKFEGFTDRYPTTFDPNICLYAPRKAWGLAGRKDIESNIPGLCYPDTVCNQDYSTWEREYLNRPNTINFQDLQDEQEYIFICSYFQINQLIDVKPTSDSKYIRSITEPFSDEMKLDAERIKNWLNLLNLDLHGMESEDNLHASGHASGKEIQASLEKINQKTIIPIHTEYPDHLKHHFNNISCPKYGKTIEI